MATLNSVSVALRTAVDSAMGAGIMVPMAAFTKILKTFPFVRF